MYSALIADLAANGVRGRSLLSFVYALIFNQGFTVAFWYRVGNHFRKFRILSPVSKIISRHVARQYGCYIALSAEIGPGLCLPHPVGICIGENVRVGRNVRIYQNVTLGIRSVKNRTVPVVGDSCVIYAGAVVAGACVLTEGQTIAANKTLVG